MVRQRPTAADEIEDDLSDIQDEIDNYDEDTPEVLSTNVPSVVGSISDYLSDVTSNLLAVNVNTIYSNNPNPNAFAKTLAGEY